MKFNFSALERSLSEDSDSSAESVPLPGPGRLRPPVPRDSSGTSEFASPRTAASSGSGESTVGGSTSADLPVGLLLVENPSQLCCGVIGDRTKGHFCCLPAHQCSIKSHGSNKFDVAAQAWYAKTPGRRESAFLSIVCVDSSIPSEDIRAIMQVDLRTPEVWRAFFSSFGRELLVDTSAAGDGSVSELGSPSAADFARAAEELATPRSVFIGRAVRSVSERAVDVPDIEVVGDIAYDGVLPQGSNWDEALGSMVAEWSKIGANFDKLKRMFIALGEEQDRLGEGVLQDFNLIESKAKLVDGKIHLLKERIGHDVAASDGGIKTVWTAIAEHQRDISVLQAEVKSLKTYLELFGNNLSKLQDEVGEVLPMQDQVSEAVQDLDYFKIAFSKFENDYKETMESLSSFLKNMTGRLDALEKPKPVSSGNRYASAWAPTKLMNQGAASDEDVLDLTRRVGFLEREIRELRDSVLTIKQEQQEVKFLGTRPPQGYPQVSAGERQRAKAWEGGFGSMNDVQGNDPVTQDIGHVQQKAANSEQLAHILSEIEYLRGRVTYLETPNRGSAIEINGFKFSSVADAKLFLKRTKLDVGACVDLLTALLSMGSKGLSGKERADELHSAKRTATSMGLNEVLASMSSSRPPKLYAKGGKGKVGSAEDGFLAIPTYNKWIGTGVNGMKKTLTTEMENYLKGLEGTLRGHDEGALLARTLISHVRAQWQDFVSFLERGYSKLKGAAKFSEKSAWNLMGQYGIAYFEAMGPYRAAASRLENPESLDDQAALLWAVLQCHRVTQEFIEKDWDGHPAIVRQNSLFMLTERVDPSEMVDVLSVQDRLVKQAKAVDGKVEALSTQVNTIKRSADNTAHALQQLKNQKKKD